MLLEDVDPEHRCDLQTLRATTRFDAEELQSVLSEMGDRAAGIETRCVRRRLTCGIGALAEYPGFTSEVPQLYETDQVVTALPGELPSATFDATLTRGIPLRIQGMQHRLQGEWTPTAMSEAVTDVDIDCIDCNSSNEETTTMPASSFFARLATPTDHASEPVYKVKASRGRAREVPKPYLTEASRTGLQTRTSRTCSRGNMWDTTTACRLSARTRYGSMVCTISPPCGPLSKAPRT